jgi:putative DNA primase/helicase
VTRHVLTAAEYERARTWLLELARVLTDGRYRDEGHNRRFLGQGGLVVHRRTGAWYSHSSSKRGGYSPILLIAFLRSCTNDEAAAWLKAFLDAHPGTGDCECATDEDDDATPASAETAKEFLERIVDVAQSPAAAAYITGERKIDFPIPVVGFVGNGRCGEGAFVGILTSHQRTVGVQVLYITPEGRKSTVTPNRRRFMLETAPDAVFEMPYAGASTDAVICEGLEDALTAYRYGKCGCRIIGLPGIGTLSHLLFAKGTRVTIARDGDAPDSEAAKALQRGIDALILAGIDVHLTELPPPGLDLNAILQEAGVEEVQNFLARTTPATLSLHGEIERLARLDDLTYAQNRKAEAKRLGIPVATLDKERQKVCDRIAAAAKAAAQSSTDDWSEIEDTPVYHTPVNGGELMDELIKCISSFVIMKPLQCFTVALWIIFTYVFDIAYNLPKLMIKSAERRSGKTRLLQLLRYLVSRAKPTDRISSAMLPRVITQDRPTLLMDETDTYVKNNETMRGILDTGFDRDTYVHIGVKVGDDWIPTPFNAWCPQALAGIGSLHPTLIDRSFLIELERKPRTVKVGRLRRRSIPPLQILAQKCARWGEDNTAAVEDAIEAEFAPETPEDLHDRAADAWEICIIIADLISEECGDKGHAEQARRAASEISGDDTGIGSEGEMLLSDIRDIFEDRFWDDTAKAYKKIWDNQAKAYSADPNKRAIPSGELVAELNNRIDRPWPECNKGFPLSQAGLAARLKEFHISPGPYWDGKTRRGYTHPAFERVFERYLPPLRRSSTAAKTENLSSVLHSSPFRGVRPQGTQTARGFQPEIKVQGKVFPYTLKSTGEAQEPSVPYGLTPRKGEECNTEDKFSSPSARAGNAETSENLGDSSISAKSDGSTEILGRIIERDGVTFIISPRQASNGLDRSHSLVEERILEMRRQHPGWSFRRIADACMVPEKRAKQTITAAEKGSHQPLNQEDQDAAG